MDTNWNILKKTLSEKNNEKNNHLYLLKKFQKCNGLAPGNLKSLRSSSTTLQASLDTHSVIKKKNKTGESKRNLLNDISSTQMINDHNLSHLNITCTSFHDKQNEVDSFDRPKIKTPLDLFPSLSISKFEKVGKYVAIDCEMVGVGVLGQSSALARISIVNYHGRVLLDTTVRPLERVTDYRYAITGLTSSKLVSSPTLPEIQDHIYELLKNKIIIGHALKNDFRAIIGSNIIPKKNIRDTSTYKPFRKALGSPGTPSLKKLALHFLDLIIQDGTHDSVDDARTAMLLYRHRQKEWESLLHLRYGGHLCRVEKKIQTKVTAKGAPISS